jgi:hypothetical protein
MAVCYPRVNDGAATARVIDKIVAGETVARLNPDTGISPTPGAPPTSTSELTRFSAKGLVCASVSTCKRHLHKNKQSIEATTNAEGCEVAHHSRTETWKSH